MEATNKSEKERLTDLDFQMLITYKNKKVLFSNGNMDII